MATKYNLVRAPDNSTAETEVPQGLTDVIRLLPKRYQTKARGLIHYLAGRINLDSDLRVVYDDGTTGSHILDLIRYYTYPKILKIHRPLDAVQFGLKLKEIGVPDATISRSVVLESEHISDTEDMKQKLKAVKKYVWQTL